MSSKPTIQTFMLVLFAAGPQGVRAGASAMVAHDLSISIETPPARILVVDAQGRRAGAAPEVVLTTEGMPPEDNNRQFLGVLEEIPNTDTEVQNIADEEPPYALMPTTEWMVRIVDGGAQTYTVSLTGMVAGICKIRIRPNSGTDGKLLPITWTSVLVTPGKVQLIRIMYDPPRTFQPVVERVLTASDLPEEVDAACELGLIKEPGVCQSLKAKAEAAAKALTRGRTKAARGAVGAFLNELKAQGGTHVQEPALTILREEAEALLSPPLPMKKSKAKAAASVRTKNRQ